MIEITLLWPDKRLSPNSRCNWREKAEAVKEARAIGKCLMHNRMTGVFKNCNQATYIFFPPDKRKRDIDNCLSMCKSYQDGVCSEIGIDDSRIKRTVLEWGDVTPGGKVVLTLEEMK